MGLLRGRSSKDVVVLGVNALVPISTIVVLELGTVPAGGGTRGGGGGFGGGGTVGVDGGVLELFKVLKWVYSIVFVCV